MKIFLSYSRNDLNTVETVAHVLDQEDHDIFFDRESIAAGEAFTAKIRNEIAASDRFVFFVSSHSIQEGSYALSELQMAREVNANIIPVRLDDTAVNDAPASLRVINWFEPTGNLTAELAAMLSQKTRFSRRHFIVTAVAATGVVAVGGFVLPIFISKRLVANTGSRVIHHLDVCASHLPLAVNQRPPQEGDEIHESLRIKILEVLAMQAWSDKERVESLFLAIEHDPCALRVYDQLIRILGKLKRYDTIHNTLRLAIDEVTNLAAVAVTKSETKRFQNAADGLKTRQVAARKRASARVAT